ncbi:MAG: DegV family protein [Desulfovermiculus sp.]
MPQTFSAALASGYDRLCAHSDLLDAINVFPIPDADTGQNLVASLRPLGRSRLPFQELVREIQENALGNSGVIAAQFLAGFLSALETKNLHQAAELGRAKAWKAVQCPQPGTMLTVFDVLAHGLSECDPTTTDEARAVIKDLEEAVRNSFTVVPGLMQAEVVDAGALGMLLLFEGFLQHLAGSLGDLSPVEKRFAGLLSLDQEPQVQSREAGYCITALIKPHAQGWGELDKLRDRGTSVVLGTAQDRIKVHLHARNRSETKRHLEDAGQIVEWREERLAPGHIRAQAEPVSRDVHIMTDAAGSLTAEDAGRCGITLLASYVGIEGLFYPETSIQPEDLYAVMRRGGHVSTSQAPLARRHEAYDRALAEHEQVVYMGVGSAYTHNVQGARGWQEANDPQGRFWVVDTGAASGRLGLGALAASLFAKQDKSLSEVIDFVHQVCSHCREYIFLDRLTYLARGGRLSRPGAFLGDMLGMKPIVSPTSEGAVKAGVVRDSRAQRDFALKMLRRDCVRDGLEGPCCVLLQYTDNYRWVEDVAAADILRFFPQAQILVRPMSLTSGAHMGPGTWAMAFLPGTLGSEEDMGCLLKELAPGNDCC